MGCDTAQQCGANGADPDEPLNEPLTAICVSHYRGQGFGQVLAAKACPPLFQRTQSKGPPHPSMQRPLMYSMRAL